MYAKLSAEGASTQELKNISDLKTKEMQTITKFTQDHGFSERYAASKAKGEGTLTGILEKMNESQYEDALINGYDIKTSEAIARVADISIKSIMTQLNVNEAEIYQIASEQLGKINELTKRAESLEEELRLSRYQTKELELKMRAIEEGLGDDL